ncbi:MAG: c-type cytochrome [Magnetococcales bacterium]|nr:c-type cytochrome [Magnetococcales bacterium]
MTCLEKLRMAKKPLRNRLENKVRTSKLPRKTKPVNWRAFGIVLGVVVFAVAMYQSRPEKPSGLAGMRHAPADPGKISLPIPASVPTTHQAGMKLFVENCSQCHGEWAQGTDNGPALVHDYYKPSHHADFSFYKAAQYGVRAHHWSFGDMQPVPSVTRQDMDQIIPFIRWWQRENGITG